LCKTLNFSMYIFISVTQFSNAGLSANSMGFVCLRINQQCTVGTPGPGLSIALFPFTKDLLSLCPNWASSCEYPLIVFSLRGSLGLMEQLLLRHFNIPFCKMHFSWCSRCAYGCK
jgi:hypothetical protein